MLRSNIPDKGLKVTGLHTCYSAAYTTQIQEQQRFTIFEVADDWHELMIPERIMRPSVTSANGPAVQLSYIPPP